MGLGIASILGIAVSVIFVSKMYFQSRDQLNGTERCSFESTMKVLKLYKLFLTGHNLKMLCSWCEALKIVMRCNAVAKDLHLALTF